MTFNAYGSLGNAPQIRSLGQADAYGRHTDMYGRPVGVMQSNPGYGMPTGYGMPMGYGMPIAPISTISTTATPTIPVTPAILRNPTFNLPTISTPSVNPAIFPALSSRPHAFMEQEFAEAGDIMIEGQADPGQAVVVGGDYQDGTGTMGTTNRGGIAGTGIPTWVPIAAGAALLLAVGAVIYNKRR